jgi:hypothetical protein
MGAIVPLVTPGVDGIGMNRNLGEKVVEKSKQSWIPGTQSLL